MVELFAKTLSRDPDQTPRSVASDLGLCCLPVTREGVSSYHRVKVLLLDRNLALNSDARRK